MAEASLAVVVRGNLPIPVGCTPKQVRLAELSLTFDPETQTLAEICEKAGYSRTTALAAARQTLNSIGVKRATEALQLRQADSARGLMGIYQAGAATSSEDLKQLDPRDRLAATFKAVELAHSLGENVEQTGSGAAWKYRQHRFGALCIRVGKGEAKPLGYHRKA